MKKICLMLALLVGTVASASVTHEEFEALEARVSHLEKLLPAAPVCISQVDGFILENSTHPWSVSGGKWAPRSSTYVGNFEFQVIKSFVTAEGHELLAVRMFTPGYKPSCAPAVFAKADVVLLERK